MELNIEQSMRVNIQSHAIQDQIMGGTIAQAVMVLRLIEEINILKSRVDVLENKQ